MFLIDNLCSFLFWDKNTTILFLDHPSGCSDGTTDGLEEYENIQACAGSWRGHVKRARNLCAKGWHVCNPRHTNLLKLLTWQDVTSTEGCYAYNAANSLNMCTRYVTRTWRYCSCSCHKNVLKSMDGFCLILCLSTDFIKYNFCNFPNLRVLSFWTVTCTELPHGGQ